MTKKQRIKVYEKILSTLEINIDGYLDDFLCWHLSEALGFNNFQFQEANIYHEFPEFALFTEDEDLEEPWAFDNNLQRVVCLVLLIEMLK